MDVGAQLALACCIASAPVGTGDADQIRRDIAEWGE